MAPDLPTYTTYAFLGQPSYIQELSASEEPQNTKQTQSQQQLFLDSTTRHADTVDLTTVAKLGTAGSEAERQQFLQHFSGSSSSQALQRLAAPQTAVPGSMSTALSALTGRTGDM